MNTDIVKNLRKFQQGWTGGLPETPCGNGSRVSVTAKQRDWLSDIVRRYGIGSVADIGAGDLNWIGLVDWDVEYQAFDLVPRHNSVSAFDLRNEIPPKVDAILCLWVLNHMPYDDCESALNNLRASGSRYLVMTDRPKWHDEQPPGIRMAHLEELKLNHKGDRIILAEL